MIMIYQIKKNKDIKEAEENLKGQEKKKKTFILSLIFVIIILF